MAKPPQRRPRARVSASGSDPNRLIGPILRSDLIALACLASAWYLFTHGRWPLVAGLCVLGGIFAGLSLRMEGPFGLVWGSSRIGGSFVSPFGRARARRAVSPTPPA